VADGAFAYARGKAWVARGLERCFAEELTTERWSAWTLADDSVPDERLERFSDGGPLCAGGQVRRGLIDAVAAAMARDSSATWLLPDPMGRPDPFLQRARTAFIVVDDGVYWAMRTGHTRPSR